MKSYPGPGYVRNLEHDEEGRLTSIKKGSTPAFEYAYGFDGGRRWRKDLAAGSWTWYPCGVACGSGELVTMASDLSGSSWAVASTSLSGATTARVGDEWPLADLSGGVAAVMDGGGNVLGRPLMDGFGVVRNSASLSPALSRWARGSEDDEGMRTLIAVAQLAPKKPHPQDAMDLPNYKIGIIDKIYGKGCGDCIVNTAHEVADLLGDQYNQLRHCVWACKARRRCGTTCSTAIDWKELGDRRRGKGRDSDEDLLNNKIGWGFASWPGQCRDLCKAAPYVDARAL